SSPRSRGRDRGAAGALPRRGRPLLPPRGLLPGDRRDPRSSPRHGEDAPSSRQADAAAGDDGRPDHRYGGLRVVSPMLEPFGELELEADLDRDERSAEPTLVERLREALCELEVEPSVVRADPGGGSWLPAELLSWCEADPACREELREFV